MLNHLRTSLGGLPTIIPELRGDLPQPELEEEGDDTDLYVETPVAIASDNVAA